MGLVQTSPIEPVHNGSIGNGAMKPSTPARAGPEWPGLCSTCRHAHRIQTGRGNIYWRCRLSESDGRFPRYPVLPVLACIGHELMEPAAAPETSD